MASSRILSALLFPIILGGTMALAQQSMNNDAVLKLQKSGLSEDLIVQTINASSGHYNTSTDAIIALKQAGVTDKEIGAMLSKNANPNGTAPAAAPVGPGPTGLPPGVDEVGVYYKTRPESGLSSPRRSSTTSQAAFSSPSRQTAS